MICVCKGGKWKYISLGIAINPKFWYFEKNRHKHHSSNREQILKVINEQEQKYSEQILQFATKQRDNSLTTLVKTVTPEQKVETVDELFDKYIIQFKSEDRLGYLYLYSKYEISY